MPKLICPYCNRIGLSSLKKLSLGPAMSINCKKCGKKIGVDFGKAMLSGLPLIIFISLSSILTHNDHLNTNYYLGLSFFFVITIILYIEWVPIIKK